MNVLDGRANNENERCTSFLFSQWLQHKVGPTLSSGEMQASELQAAVWINCLFMSTETRKFLQL